MNRSFTRFLILGGAKVLRIPVAMVVIVLLSRGIGPEGVGNWSMIVAVAAFFQSVFLYWTQAQAVRLGREEWLSTNRLSRTWAERWPLIVLALGLSALLIAFRPFSFFERLTGLPSSWWPLPLAYLIGLWCVSEAQCLLQTTGRFTRLASFQLISELIVVIFLLMLLVLSSAASRFLAFAGIIFITTACAALVWVIEFAFSRSWGGTVTMGGTRRMAATSWPVIMSALFGYVSDWGDHLILQQFGGAGDVGKFHSCYLVMTTLMGLAAPVLVVCVPQLVDNLSRNPRAEAVFLRQTVPVVVLFWLLGLIPTLAVIPWLFGVVFGPDFASAIPILLVLCIAVPGAIFSYLYSALFNIQGRMGQSAVIIAIMTVVNMTISFSLVPEFGGLGAAIGTACSYFIYQLLYMINQHVRLSVPIALPGTLFFCAYLFGVLQWFAGESVALRVVLAIASMTAVLLLARALNFSKPGMIASMLPERFLWFGRFMDRILTRA